MFQLPGEMLCQRGWRVLRSHGWVSVFGQLAGDRNRLAQVYRRTGVLPLGSAALAGTSFGVDREALKNDLGFESISANSLDAVSDRDFAAEFLFVAAMLGVHLSRLSEALILYSTAEFGFIELADEYSTGSSLMPQKKNPDMLELTRGKSGRLIGHLTGLLTTLKALPSAYDKDLQEDKPPVFDAVDTLLKVIPVVSGVISTLSVKADRIQAALDPVMLATDLADYLVERGVPFRTAHAIVGRAVRRAIDLGLTLDRLPLSELKTIAPIFDEAVARVFDFEAAIARRNVAGGTGSQAVQAQLAQAKEYLKSQFVEPTLSGGK